MKKHVLLLVFLCTALMGMAQTVDTVDSTFYSPDSGSTYHLNSVHRRTYDAGCRNDSATYYYFDTDSPIPVLTTAARTLYSYYTNDSIRQEISQDLADSISSSADSFVNTSRRLYGYSANASGTTRYDTGYVWKNNQWKLSGVVTTSYNNAKQITFILSQSWDSVQLVYINRDRQISTFNAAGLQTVYTYQYWNGSAWMAADSIISVYDAGNYLVSDTLKNNYSGPNLRVDSYTTYYDNSKGQPDSSVKVSLRGQPTYKNYYSYYSDSVTQKQQYFYAYDAHNKVTYGRHDLYTYDTSGTTYIYTQTSENLNTATLGFELDEVDVVKETYDAGGFRTQYDFGNFYYDKNGTREYADTYLTNYHYAPCNSALPVSLLSFTANKNNNNAVLQWKTANETNTAYFNIQRSTDGIHFTAIGTIKAAGNSSVERSYAYTDFNVNTLGANKLYYRLAQQDINGTIHNSPIAQIGIANGKLSITLSPNPVQNRIGMYSPVAMSNAVIRIADMSGKVVYTSRTDLSAGTMFSIDASAFAKGVYFVTVQSGTDKQVMKLVKE